MTRQAVLHGACGAVALGLLAGCASAGRGGDGAPPEAPSAPAPAAAAAAPAPVPPAAPPGGYTWDELARAAAANCREAQALLLDAEAERRQTAVDTGWRNPQLRSGVRWGDEDEETQARTGTRTYSGAADAPRQPFTSNREWSEREFDGYTAGLRVYTSNPFVNRWLRRRGDAAARAKEAESQEAAYAVYCEVRSLCLEAEILREDAGALGRLAALREQACALRREQADAGVVSALELIRAEVRLESLRSEIREKEARRLQLVRRIAVLAGLPAEQVRLKPEDLSRQVAAAYLDGAVLTDLAFMRRPDLSRVRLEKEAAQNGVGAAKAGQVPWFEYVEGTYENERYEEASYEAYRSGYDKKDGDQTEWQVRVAVTLPVFSWLGDEVRLTRAQLAAAEAREQGLYDSIRREVGGVLEDYRAVRAERERLSAGREKLEAAITARIDALAREPAVRREDVLAAREELVEYERVCMKVERECLRLTQYLETVSGGSLTASP